MNPELYEYRDSTQRYFSAVFIRDFMKRHNVTLEEVKEMFDTIYGDKHDERCLTRFMEINTMKVTKIQVGILNKFFNLLEEIKTSHDLPHQMDRLLKNNITLKCCPHSLIAVMEHELEQFKRINLPSYHGIIQELQTEEYKEGSTNETN